MKSKFEAGMVWGTSQMARGSNKTVEPCAKPGCDPFPQCCVTGDTHMREQIQGWSITAQDEELWKLYTLLAIGFFSHFGNTYSVIVFILCDLGNYNIDIVFIVGQYI